jgi:hypothetical protein
VSDRCAAALIGFKAIGGAHLLGTLIEYVPDMIVFNHHGKSMPNEKEAEF